MFENERMTRCAICGTGLLLAAVFLFAGLPIVLLVIPVAVIFIGLVAGTGLCFHVTAGRVVERRCFSIAGTD